ncbi:fatty acid CoA ligase family protein [Hyalangium gracile]|uniref:fatty acid CoA ligase family protein n=1 Tax=Hyalangium gracile TaxID=394092 RepID=UPI001CC9874F|nr:fatty acid CoA ligase family protein [Hyalangium gracile]
MSGQARTLPQAPPINVARYLERLATHAPTAPALHLARTGETVSAGVLAERAARLSRGLAARGVAPGDRILLMVRPGLDFVALAFGLLSLGAVPVLIDPGMGRKRLLDCVEAVAPVGMVAVRLLHALRWTRPSAFRSVRLSVSLGAFPGTVRYASLLEGEPVPFTAVARRAEDPALIAFTTGATGVPKGVVFPHRVLEAQVDTLRELASLREGDCFLALLPPLALLGPGLGCSVVLPDMDVARPAAVDAARLVEAIRRWRVTLGFGSPTVWGRIMRHLEATGGTLPSLRFLMLGGAPVPPELLRACSGKLALGREALTAYGATEALPLTGVSTRESLLEAERERTERGSLVGPPVPGVSVRIVPVTDAPLERLPAALPAGEVGEVCVRGGVVASGYFGRPEADALAQVPDPGGAWHRMGDLGYLDEQGRLWFCGRKTERVETPEGRLLTACVEPVFAAHPRVERVALVGVGERPHQRAVLVVQPRAGQWPWTKAARNTFTQELLALGARYAQASGVRDVLFHRELPLDVRHQAKILRHELSRWAAEKLK